MFTAGFMGGLALLFIGIAILALITSIIRLLGPILIIIGIYYVYKTIKARKEQTPEADYSEKEEPEEFKDAAEILAEKYEGPDSVEYKYKSQNKGQ